MSYSFYQLTLILVMVIIVGNERNETVLAALLILPVIRVIGTGIYCLVTMVIGTVRADMSVHRPMLAIPFFRA